MMLPFAAEFILRLAWARQSRINHFKCLESRWSNFEIFDEKSQATKKKLTFKHRKAFQIQFEMFSVFFLATQRTMVPTTMTTTTLAHQVPKSGFEFQS